MKDRIIQATRYHDISCGHRVAGHESKCAYLHGHNYRIHFTCEAAALDSIGRVIDFSVMKSKLCMWLEERWDHRFLAWESDPEMGRLIANAATPSVWYESLVWVPFNPTAENMADYLLRVVGPRELPAHILLRRVVVEETRKCSAEASLPTRES